MTVALCLLHRAIEAIFFFLASQVLFLHPLQKSGEYKVRVVA